LPLLVKAWQADSVAQADKTVHKPSFSFTPEFMEVLPKLRRKFLLRPSIAGNEFEHR